tara:strand:- start:1004 stop:1177 length:174 start_codon:yes stop_codon:yes gene_type:complete
MFDIGAVAAISALVMIMRPSPNPDRPAARTFMSLLVAALRDALYVARLDKPGCLRPF